MRAHVCIFTRARHVNKQSLGEFLPKTFRILCSQAALSRNRTSACAYMCSEQQQEFLMIVSEKNKREFPHPRDSDMARIHIVSILVGLMIWAHQSTGYGADSGTG